MKFLSSALLILLSLPAGAQGAPTDVNYETLSQRFVTSVKEAQVDSQFLGMAEVQQCASETIDVSNQASIKAAQEKSAQCMRDLFKTVPEGRLTELSNKLQLDAYGVVKGKSNTELVNYLASRMEKALYGKDASGNVKKLGDQKLVDQKVFVDIYETQIGKNILLEISNYCYARLAVGSATGAARMTAIAGINMSTVATTISAGGITDDKELIRGVTDEDTNIYDKVKDDLESITNPSGTPNPRGPKALGDMFIVCATIIPKMCEAYENCLCKFKNPNGTGCTTDVNAPTCNSLPAGGKEPVNGRHACHVAARLKGYRTNLFAVAETKKRFDAIKDDSGKFTTDANKANEVYDRSQADQDESFDSLTSFTTSEAELATKSQDMATAAGEIDAEECARNPENPECAKFYYNGSEVQRFAQSSAGYTAATIVESERINKLTTDKAKLVEYLKSRAYFDIAEKLENSTMNEEAAVAAARARFETERDATFKEMTQAFERKQFATDLDPNDPAEKERRAGEVQKEYQNKGKEFQQLILFNNVVSSYLDLKRINAEGVREDAGLNLRALTRETERAASVDGAQESIEYFTGLSSGESSKIENSDTPIVDIGFLDQILGKTTPDPEEPR